MSRRGPDLFWKRVAAGLMIGVLPSGFVTPAFAIELKEAKESSASKKPRFASASVWEVSSETSTVYLAGSVHLLRAEDHPLPPVYDEAYEDSEELCFEVDLGASTDLEAQQRLLDIGRYPAGETIKSHIGEETYALLRDFLEKRGLGGAFFESMKPGLLAVTIASLEYIRLGAQPQLGVDMVYHVRATKDGKPVRGFETADFQVRLFDRLAPEKQERVLKETLEGLDESASISRELIEAWRTGDVSGMEDLLNEEMTKDKEIARVLLYKRNRAWMAPILKLLEGDRNAMVIVGAGHLVGKGSVVDRLRKRGFDVVQMRYPAPVNRTFPAGGTRPEGE